MIIVYTPAGGEAEHYDARTLLVSEASIVARTIDQKWPEVREGLAHEDLDAMRGVVWVIKKRSNPSLRFGEFDPGVDDMVTRMDKSEVETYVAEAIALAAQDTDVTGEQIAYALRNLPAAALDPEHAEAVIRDMTADPKDGAQAAAERTADDAAPSPTSATDDSSTSVSSATS